MPRPRFGCAQRSAAMTTLAAWGPPPWSKSTETYSLRCSSQIVASHGGNCCRASQPTNARRAATCWRWVVPGP
eukprot:8996626-Lingulodinium_polyedra.AAC.1